MVKATKKWWPIFVLPTFAAFIIGFIVPFCEGLYLSFCKFTTINKAVWIGASNYVKVFQDPSSSPLWALPLFLPYSPRC